MSGATKSASPSCQLLQRQDDMFERGDTTEPLWAVAPPQDAWLMAQVQGVISADHAVLKAVQANSKVAQSPFTQVSIPNDARVVLFWPKAHELGIWWLKWLCEHLSPGATINVVGEHQGGIKRVPKVLTELGLNGDKIDSARRCSLFATQAQPLEPPSDAAWKTFDALGLTLCSHPGVFGHGKFDEGTALLLETLAHKLAKKKRRILDVGCGDGIITAWLAQRGHEVTAVDISEFALEATRKTLEANQLTGRVLASDVYQALDDERFDLIISNPPFHQERDIHYGAAGRLISHAPSHLHRGGQLILVANAFLPYPERLTLAFDHFEVLADDRRFKVYWAGSR
ncbi:methyltransferase [Halomonas vilamensis]|uniref:Methyltransferase n=1 Tax=Vreelandella vilamensis TaxID=531309 RepID=A0ABU1H1J0_9GAMM|nr:methyltransferase [Halomonas vilamensis]MDR5898175.1 methyltransferase [Halomonas vilamensis]